ncbi:MAG: LuxR C-terminal-related transcriptional regulator, partial [bacterium]|nr:LuxR C-terminal-related transcriptional regulator [bacterium]
GAPREPSDIVTAEAAALRLVRAMDEVSGPLCVLLDDAQWCDHDSQIALALATRRPDFSHVFAVMTSQVQANSMVEHARQLARQPLAGANLELDPWSEVEVMEFLRRHVRSLPTRESLEQIMRATGGLPIYLDSLVRRLEGVADDAHSLEAALEYTVRTHARGASPVAQEVSAAHDALDHAEWLGLVTIALAEQITPHDLESAMSELGGEIHVEQLLDSGLVSEGGRGFHCRHGVIAAAIEARASAAEIRSVHGALGRVLPTARALRHRFLGRQNTPDAELGQDLWAQAERFANVRDVVSAGRSATWAAVADQRWAIPAAILFLRLRRSDRLRLLAEAFDALPESWATVAFRALVANESLPRQFDSLTANDLAGLDDPELLLVCWAVHRTCLKFAALGRFSTPPPALAPAIAEAARRSEDASSEYRPDLVELRYLLEIWECFRGRSNTSAQSALARLEELVERAREVPGAEIAADSAATVLGSLALGAGRFTFARHALSSALSGALADPDFTFNAATKAYYLDFLAGRWDEANRAIERLMGEALAIRNDVGSLQLAAFSSMIPLCRGEHEAAAPALMRVRAMAGNAEYSSALGAAALAQAWGTFVLRGPDAEVAHLLEQLWSTRLGGVFAGIPSAVPLIRALAAEGYLSRAEEMIETVATYEIVPWLADYVTAHGRAYLAIARGDLTLAETSLARARTALESAGEERRFMRLLEVLLTEDEARLALRRPTGASPELARRLREAEEFLSFIRASAWADALAELAHSIASASPELVRLTAVPDQPPERIPDVLADLTTRERDIALRIAEGMSNKEVADQDVLSVRTVEFHVRNILRKTGLRSRVELRQEIREARRRAVG